MHKILISGYYGFNNVGDEAILRGLVEGVKRIVDPIDIVVLSQRPEFTAAKHEVRAVKRINIFKIAKEMKDMDLLVSGGGSLFQDVTSKRSIAYYIGIIWLAKRVFNKKVMIYSQGIGPVNKSYNRWLLGRMLNMIDCINVRDEKSALELKRLGVTKDILVTTDTVFGISKPSLTEGQNILRKMDPGGTKPYIGISVRHWHDNEKIIKETAKLCAGIARDTGHKAVLIPFHFHKDLKLMQSVYDRLDDQTKRNVLIMDEYLYVEDYLSFIGNMDIMLAMRLHGLIFSVLMGVYPVGLSYDPKIQSFLHMMQREDAMEVEDMDADILLDQIKDAILNNTENKERLEKSLMAFKDMANTHNKSLYECLTDEGGIIDGKDTDTGSSHR